MKLLADENFPPSLISYLQKKHHNVKRIQRSTRSASDASIIQLASRENRIIITFDKDFLKVRTEIIVNVMVFEFPDLQPRQIIPYIDEIIQAMNSLKKKKHFIAVYSKKGLELIPTQIS